MGQQFDDEILGKTFDAKLARKSIVFLKPYKRQLFLGVLAMMLVSASALVAPKLLQMAIDDGIKKSDVHMLLMMGAMSVGVYIARWFGMRSQMRIVAVLGQHVIYDMRHKLFSHIQNLSLSFFDNREVGRIISRLTGDISAVNELITSGALQLVADIMTVVGVACIMMKANIKFSLVVFSLCPLVCLSVAMFRRKSRLAYRDVRRKVATVTASVAENVSGVKVVRSFHREGENLNRFKRVNRENQSAFMRVAAIRGLFEASMELMYSAGICIVLWYGGLQVKASHLTVGEVVAFISYVGLFLYPMVSISQLYQTMQSAMAGAERIFEIIDTEPEVIEKPDAKELPTIVGAVEFREVNFAYGDTPILKEVNFSVEPGQTIAIVGPTGAGKSTIINLLGRQYDIESGSITIDGRDIRDVTLKSLRSQIGIVLQDSFLFPVSIRENIRYGRLNATDQEIEETASAVGVHEFIMGMPKGYETVLNEGATNISVGQKQLISFARALLADPRILILDEATSSIDASTELLIQKALATLLKGRTSFVIAHRLSTISEADEILVVDSGEIVERGSNEELLNVNGLYRKLYEAQFRYNSAETASECDMEAEAYN